MFCTPFRNKLNTKECIHLKTDYSTKLLAETTAIGSGISHKNTLLDIPRKNSPGEQNVVAWKRNELDYYL